MRTVYDLSDDLQHLLTEVPELVHSWRFLTGVVYALQQYYQIVDRCPRQNLPDKEYIEETTKVLSLIKEERLPDDNWLRGFFYNAAVMRLHAAYERFFKVYLSPDFDEQHGDVLYKEIQKKFPSSFPKGRYEDSLFGEIGHEVNSLKHFPGGVDLLEREQPDLLHQGLTKLVAFLKLPDVVNELQTKFKGRGTVAGRGKTHK